jgi:hypothetical protein
MRSSRTNLRKHWLSLFLAALTVAVVIVNNVGCGGGGGGAARADSGPVSLSSGSSALSGEAAPTNGSVVLKIERSASKLPDSTVTVRATVVGTDISASAPFGVDVSEVTLQLFAPLGPQTIRIDALDASGNVVASGEIQVTVGVGNNNAVTVPVDILGAPTPSPTAPPASVTLRWEVQPPLPVVAKLPFVVSVEALDPTTGQRASGFTGAVTLALAQNPAGDTFAPVTVNAVGGVATFSSLVLITPASGYRFSATSALASNTAESNPFDVVTASLEFVTQPGPIQPFGQNMVPSDSGIQVAVVDGGGKTIAVDGLQITMSALKATPPQVPPPVLLGTTGAVTVQGVATFSGLQMGSSGRDFELQAAAGAVTTTSARFAVGPRISTGVVCVTVFDTVQEAYQLRGYDLNTGLSIHAPTAISGYVPVAISVWPGNGSSGPVALVVGSDNNVYFYDALTLQPVGPVSTNLPSPSGLPGAPQLIKIAPRGNVFYLTAQSSSGDVIDILDLSSWPTATMSKVNSSAGSFNQIHGLAVDPGADATTSPGFVVDQADNGALESWTISGGTLISPSTVGDFTPADESYLDVTYTGLGAVGLVTFGSLGSVSLGTSIGTFEASGSVPYVQSFSSTAGHDLDVRNDVRFYATTSNPAAEIANALVCNSTTSQVEIATVSVTTGGGAAKPQQAVGLLSLDGQITGTVLDPDGVVFQPSRLALSKSANSFVQALVVSSGSSSIPLIDLVDGTAPTVYASIDLGAGITGEAAAVYQPSETISGQ